MKQVARGKKYSYYKCPQCQWYSCEFNDMEYSQFNYEQYYDLYETVDDEKQGEYLLFVKEAERIL